MADLAIITSLYRSDRFLPGYLRHVRDAAHRLGEAGLSVEVVAVANDATARERALLGGLRAAPLRVTVLEVARETLYASWNRGIRAAGAPVLTPWNVDDIRTPEGLIEGCRILAGDGPGLVYFPFTYARPVRLAPFLRVWVRYPGRVRPFDPKTFRQQGQVGPFMMFTRRLYDAVGPFDEWFRVWGDVEWIVRASHRTDFRLGTSPGGTFRLHGGNLGYPNDPKGMERRHAEWNVLALEHKGWDLLTAIDPAAMRAIWQDRNSRVTLPDWLEQRLWGPEARERWEAALRAERPAPGPRLPWPRRIVPALRWRWQILARALLDRS